jgi:nicotinamide-nucleotide adenylyltransferase
VIKEIMDGYDSIVIGIGSAQHSHSTENPFTAGERHLMIANTLKKNGISDYYIVPIIDINRYALWVSHVVSLIPKVDVVFTHNPLTRRLFRESNFEVKAPKVYDRETLSGREIRRRIINNESWHDLVPSDVVKVIEDISGVERLRELSQNDIIDVSDEEEQVE